MKAATKLAIKFGAKLSAKGVAGFVPVFGAAVGAGVNAYFVKHITDWAELYYAAKKALHEQVPQGGAAGGNAAAS